MTTRISLDPAVFAPTGRYADYASNVKRIAVYVGGGDRYSNLNGAFSGASYTGPVDTNGNHSNAALKITVNPVDLDDTQVNRMPQLIKNDLAALVDNGTIVVERPVGAPVTAATIRGW